MFRGPNRLRFLKKKLLARHFQKFGGINRSHTILSRGWHLLDVPAGLDSSPVYTMDRGPYIPPRWK